MKARQYFPISGHFREHNVVYKIQKLLSPQKESVPSGIGYHFQLTQHRPFGAFQMPQKMRYFFTLSVIFNVLKIIFWHFV